MAWRLARRAFPWERVGLGSKSFSPRLGITVVVVVVVVELGLEMLDVVVVREERKRKSWVSSERSVSGGLEEEVVGWELEAEENWWASSSSESDIVG